MRKRSAEQGERERKKFTKLEKIVFFFFFGKMKKNGERKCTESGNESTEMKKMQTDILAKTTWV